jgi:hypothetical protein
MEDDPKFAAPKEGQLLVAVPLKAQQEIYLAVQLAEKDVDALVDSGVAVKYQKPSPPPDTDKKGFAFLAPVFAGLPGTAMVVGAATLGIIGGAAGAIGGKVGNWIWPDKK